jgi:hypothetical protein
LRHDSEDRPGRKAGPNPHNEAGEGISAGQFTELFAGEPPIDPDQLRADLDQVADPRLVDPYDRAHGEE